MGNDSTDEKTSQGVSFTVPLETQQWEVNADGAVRTDSDEPAWLQLLGGDE